jgi:MoaA/NifB/PqqE/SkfB family radical SAM enzyme
MVVQTKAWQRKMVRSSMVQYRQALENYYIKGKQVIKTSDGQTAFSLLSPPIASSVAKRRIRLIMGNLLAQGNQDNAKDITPLSRTPHFVTMAVTYDCQCGCTHCSATAYKDRTENSKEALNLAELKNAVAQVVKLGATCVVFTGGEPLLFKGIYDLIAAVDKQKAISTIFTNGEYLNQEAILRLKQAGLYGAFVSFDDYDAGRHDTNRKRKGIFNKAAEGIRLCQENGILTGISTYVTKEKLQNGGLDAMMELGKRLNVLEVFIFDVIPTGMLQEKYDLLLNTADFNQIKEFRAKYNTRNDYPRIIHQTMLTSIAYPCTGEGCPAGIAHLHLRANGDVSPCDFAPLSFGNLRSDSLEDVWRRMTTSKIYATPSPCCRLSDRSFWDNIDLAAGKGKVMDRKEQIYQVG